MYEQLLITAALVSALGLFWVVRQWRDAQDFKNTKRTPAARRSWPGQH